MMGICRFAVSNIALLCLMDDIQAQVDRLSVTNYAPLVRFHPYETYLPTSVEAFREHAVAYTALQDKIGPATDSLNQLPKNAYLAHDEQDIKGLPLVGRHVLAPVYVHVKNYQDETFTDIQYFFFYAYNGCVYFRVGYKYNFAQRKRNIPICQFGRHQGDWEHVTVRVNQDGTFREMYFSQHGQGRWMKPQDLQWNGSHPIVYPSLHSHANLPMEQVATVQELPISGLKFISSLNWIKLVDVTHASGTLRYDWMPERAFSPQWHTWELDQIVLVSGQEDWLKFMGHWGAVVDNRSAKAPPNMNGLVETEIKLWSQAAITAGLIDERYLRGYGPRTPSAKKLWRAPE